jgi:hypothetical protein
VGKKTGIVALSIGMFLLVLAAGAKWHAYPRLAKVPLDQQTRTVSLGPDATYLNIGAEGGPAIEHGELQSVREVKGQVEEGEDASDELDRDIAVFDTYTYTDTPDYDPESGEDPLTGRYDRVAFDRTSGAAVDCCDTFTEATGEHEEITFAGQYFKLPFNAQKTTYQFWDSSLESATDMVYQAEETIDGMDTYEFVQTIEPTQIAELEVPGNLVGEPDTPSVLAQRMYGNVRTIWVEPETGVIIRAQEQQRSTLDVDGEERAVITEVTIGYNDETVSNNIDRYSSDATGLKALRVWVPWMGGILGGLLVLLGIVALLRSGRSRRGKRRAEPSDSGSLPFFSST